jgi:tryptophan synthase alpha chain
MNRIEERLQLVKEKNEKAFVTYMTAGLPDMKGCAELIRAQEEAGIDVVELGIPFSDPVADGPVIQAASYKSIQQGTNLKKVFDMVTDIRKEGCKVPLVFMMYFNTILYYGLEAFVEKCTSAGVDGLIVPDLPFEEQKQLQDVIDKVQGAPILIQLVTPVSGDRIPMLLEKARGFVYCVSSMGVTGQAADFHKNVVNYLKQVKSVSKIPVMMGFGIRTAADVIPMKDIIDGCIVGSHFINLMEENHYSTEVAKEYVSTFKKEMNQI